ncbi:MAG: bifunctional glycoside hydrolase 114/ polysaccharide deacetylase family protein [Acidiferrobacter sp.]
MKGIGKWRVGAAAILALAAPVAAFAAPSIAFYYGRHPPVHTLQAFHWTVVQPYARFQPTPFDNHDHRAFAYVSVGEVAPHTAIPTGCRLGTDTVWHQNIVDQARHACRAYTLHTVVDPLWARGYRGFFLDTLDAYRLAVTSPTARAAQRVGLIRLIRDIKAQHPTARLIFNRGFALLPAVHTLVTAVAAESLFDGWNAQTRRYGPVPAATRHRLLKQLAAAHGYGLPTIAIDYLPARARAQAWQDAQRIMALGITPWVTNHNLSIVGVGRLAVMPRKILMLYSGPQDVQHTALNWYASMPLNYLGYSTRIVNVSKPLPHGLLTGRYAGIVTWFESNYVPNGQAVYTWLRRQMHAGVPVAILGSFGFAADNLHLQPLGLRTATPPAGLIASRVAYANRRYLGYEVHPQPSAPDNFLPLILHHGRVLLRLTNTTHQHEDAVGLTPWGGYALAPNVVTYLGAVPGPRKHVPAAWILNPFRFFRQALRLPPMPVVDTTTESGRRMLMAQIDGDGFANKSWIYRYRDQYAGAVILHEILERYQVPTAASFIVSYFTPHGLFPHQAAALTAIARQIAAIPWVEIGSHTYSHPFNWPALERDPALSGTKGDMRYGYNLPVPGYTHFSVRKEVVWAAHWINHHIAPPGKKVRVLQWSGDCDPDARAVALAYKIGITNVNGGGATITDAKPFLTKVRGLGIWKGRYFQVYAPMQDENVYTHSWTSPFYYGYVRALQTFRLTDRPRRLKPLDIYYHFYSGARVAGLRALQTVLSWAVRQPTTPVFLSQFAHIAIDFNHTVIARTRHGWLITANGADQELRIPRTMGYPDLRRSVGVAGFNDHLRVRYITIAPHSRTQLVLRPTPPRQPYLRDANAPLTFSRRSAGLWQFGLRGHLPLFVQLGGAAGCRITVNGQAVAAHTAGPLTTLTLDQHYGHFAVVCSRP